MPSAAMYYGKKACDKIDINKHMRKNIFLFVLFIITVLNIIAQNNSEIDIYLKINEIDSLIRYVCSDKTCSETSVVGENKQLGFYNGRGYFNVNGDLVKIFLNTNEKNDTLTIYAVNNKVIKIKFTNKTYYHFFENTYINDERIIISAKDELDEINSCLQLFIQILSLGVKLSLATNYCLPHGASCCFIHPKRTINKECDFVLIR